jgi:hypothetical protein
VKSGLRSASMRADQRLPPRGMAATAPVSVKDSERPVAGRRISLASVSRSRKAVGGETSVARDFRKRVSHKPI